MSKQLNERTVEAEVPERLDRWLADHVEALSRNRVQQLIAQGAVSVNGQVCDRKKELVAAGDRIVFTVPETQPYELTPEDIPLDILYEDDQLLIVNKPAGMVVHPAPGHATGTLVHALLFHCGEQLTGVGGVQRPGIVHRLDKNTTGAIVVAKTEIALHSLQQQIQAKTAQREYLGIVNGAPKAEQGTINQPIGRHPKHRKKMSILPIEAGGRIAITHWKSVERLGNYTLMHFQLETGRTHQIRVHSTHLGLPIIGDPDYGSGKFPGVRLPGQALHAFRLTLSHPISQAVVSAQAPLPQKWEQLLAQLRSRQR
ncbi:RluA family pseudouridine synthase [cf. Phormidesmis sp. LEGE 11477]|uniref:RluA family pseudouridine synthase n=1 Tax=cf. Phormidesmis sp. LEGE 11477 TaxID=1828680 RepID=UPI00187FB51E|nr:RluA family pseudouridine synthase [cf. Phormidesmis sp. LEGE 11477]MBE9062618.1 RluA family pseudouridine synthase [cf. Phormidesmis sp. LEGE 11477]